MTLTTTNAVLAGGLLLFAAIGLMPAASATPTPTLHRRFEYKHSFRAPNLAQRDGSIPFWTVTGDAIASSEQLRLAPSMRSRKGIAWNKRPFVESDFFEARMSFRVTGQGKIGADGLALWYTAAIGTLGDVFGSNDYWTGMGLLFDSFDNDGGRNNPYVGLMINDGTRQYDHQTDGRQQVLQGCQRDFRNKPFPITVKVEYINNVLSVFMTDGLSQQPRYEICFRAENVYLPKNGFFGVSAATGGLADDHDVVDFSVYSLSSIAPAPAQPIPQDEKQKYDAEFEKQMQDYEAERQKFKEAHPDRAKPDSYDEEYAKYYEDAAARELRLIYESQNAIHQVLQQLETKITQIQQAQISGGGAVATGAGAGAPPVPPAAGGVAPGFQQHEKNEVIQGVRDVLTTIRDMRNYVNEIFTRTYNLEQKLGAGAQGGGEFATLHSLIHQVQSDVRDIRAAQIAKDNSEAQQASASGGLTECSNCATSTLFVLVALIQSGVILFFVYIRSKSDKAKFY